MPWQPSGSGPSEGPQRDVVITVDGVKDIPMEPDDGKIVRLGADMMPMAGDAIADQTIDMGATVMVQSTVSNADDDMLYYAWSSDDDTIAIFVGDDMDMSMATIAGVGVGTATITVFRDRPRQSWFAMQTFMVTVEAADDGHVLAGYSRFVHQS